MVKKHRRHIRLHGKMIKSPPFANASDADKWYQDKLREKQHLKEGLPMPLDQRTTLKQYFNDTWLPRRKKSYSKATWGSDEQRFNDYVLPTLGNMKVSKINSLQVRGCLLDAQQKHELSISTRNKIRSLLSKILGEAMVEKNPLRTTNPALGIRFQDPRVGKAKPKHISREKDINEYLKAAKSLGPMIYSLTCTLLMSALRKSELIALTWGSFDDDAKEFVIAARYVQADKKIMKGTKAGREENRIVPIPDVLVEILLKYKAKSDYQAKDDYIFCREDGSHLLAHDPNNFLKRVSGLSGVKASPHALRHSFGRWFAANGGQMKALQTIMGHSNYKTTELYSELAAQQVKSERNRVSFDVGTDDEDEGDA